MSTCSHAKKYSLGGSNHQEVSALREALQLELQTSINPNSLTCKLCREAKSPKQLHHRCHGTTSPQTPKPSAMDFQSTTKSIRTCASTSLPPALTATKPYQPITGSQNPNQGRAPPNHNQLISSLFSPYPINPIQNPTTVPP